MHGGFTISTRHVISVALLVSAALALTACGPDDPTATNAAGSSPAAAPPSAAASKQGAAPTTGGGKSATPTSSKGAGKSDCPTLAPGHRYIWVDHLEGAMNNVVAADAQAHCDPTMNEGAAYSHNGTLKTYGLSLDAKITVIAKDGPKTVIAKNGDLYTGIAHVKACADPNGAQLDGAKLPAGYFCAGQNFFDVVVDSHNTITEMTELSGS
ncbi:hypothetical protein P3T36_004243 [Kitasatospora sp. MAP12-15]|uniref:hypothetical protein n=1 Tax=unclassified Kitasatospora TaxID=2633591 RepID=UPI002475E4EC|nr:hypothetical protein [Kitasatospora sp. MAP12-44]MDH6108292.1 hypothetical protein [Kitasatospora sp. MAP12-44]